jgi:SSS family solute:Na+ symporter
MAYLLPPGIRGLVAAGLLAALMSSLASVFNSCSTLFTVDIYKKLRPQTSEKKLVQTGRIATLMVVGLGIAWIPVMSNISGVLYEYLQSVQSYIAPPITAVFLLGISWKRMNASGAMATLIGGFLLGMSRLVAELNKEYLEGWLFYWADLNFLHFCILLFAICLSIGVTISLATQPQSTISIRGLTFGTLTLEQRNKTKNSYNVWDIIASAGIVLIIIFILTYFTG